MQSTSNHLADDIPLFPEFVLSTFDEGDEDVHLTVSRIDKPSIRRHASLALLYGLAILELDKAGVIEAKIEELLEAGPINEVDAANRITQLVA